MRIGSLIICSNILSKENLLKLETLCICCFYTTLLHLICSSSRAINYIYLLVVLGDPCWYQNTCVPHVNLSGTASLHLHLYWRFMPYSCKMELRFLSLSFYIPFLAIWDKLTFDFAHDWSKCLLVCRFNHTAGGGVWQKSCVTSILVLSK